MSGRYPKQTVECWSEQIKEMLKAGEIDEIIRLSGKEQVVDTLTKEGGKVELIMKYVENPGEERKRGRLINNSVSYREKREIMERREEK